MKHNRKPPPPELIAALRDCAANGLSYEQAATELTAHKFRLTRNAVAGLARRAKPRIAFKSTKRGHPLWELTR